MEIASRTLREVEFRQQLRGYHQDDVDEFLERVAAGIEVLQDRLREANERATRAEKAASEGGGRTGQEPDDDAVRRTLVLAQRTADLAVKEAKEEAARLVSEAETKARTVVSEAETRARQRLEEGERQLREDVARLTATRSTLGKQLEGLEQHLEAERQRVQRSLEESLEWFRHNLPGPGEKPEVVAKALEEAASTPGGDSAEGAPSGKAADEAASTGSGDGRSARDQLGRLLASQSGDQTQTTQGAPASRTPGPAREGAPEPSRQGGRQGDQQGRRPSDQQGRRPGGQQGSPPGGQQGDQQGDPNETRVMPAVGKDQGRSVFDVEETEDRRGSQRERQDGDGGDTRSSGDTGQRRRSR